MSTTFKNAYIKLVEDWRVEVCALLKSRIQDLVEEHQEDIDVDEYVDAGLDRLVNKGGDTRARNHYQEYLIMNSREKKSEGKNDQINTCVVNVYS